MSYHVDCLNAAVSVLAGHGHIKKRLITAYEEHLDKIRDEELPVAAQEPFADLRQKLHRVSPLNGEGPVCASVRKMSIKQADACAKSVVDMLAVALRQKGSSDERPVASGSEEQVPPFLVKTL